MAVVAYPAAAQHASSGHHQLLHDGRLSISGRAPDELRFERDGRPLSQAPIVVDKPSRSPSPAPRVAADAADAANAANDANAARAAHVANAASRSKPTRFDEVVVFEQAKRALVDLGYKARAAHQALLEVRAHAGADSNVASLVKAVLARGGTEPIDDDDNIKLATKALTQLGYPPKLAKAAIDAACSAIGADADLEILIREALRRCA